MLIECMHMKVNMQYSAVDSIKDSTSLYTLHLEMYNETKCREVGQ